MAHEAEGTVPDDLIRIDVVASMLDRSTATVRRWSERGTGPDGLPFKAEARDTFTNRRFFRRSVVERLMAKRLRPER